MGFKMTSLSDLAGAGFDDVIDVPIASLLNVQLEGMGGQKITTARLGQLNGSKAVRLAINRSDAEGAPDLNIVSPAVGNVELADVPALPEPAGLPEIGSDAGLPDLPMPEEAGLPDLPPLPGADGVGDLPDLPPLEPSGDLPDLPDQPPLEP